MVRVAYVRTAESEAGVKNGHSGEVHRLEQTA